LPELPTNRPPPPRSTRCAYRALRATT